MIITRDFSKIRNGDIFQFKNHDDYGNDTYVHNKYLMIDKSNNFVGQCKIGDRLTYFGPKERLKKVNITWKILNRTENDDMGLDFL